MMDLQIYFGLSGDNPVCHEFTTAPGNYAGKIVAGPKKLLEHLELHLGLSGIFLSDTDRVLLLKEKFSALPATEFPFFISFNNDPIGVSRRLLNLWDSWRMAGWQTIDRIELPKRMQQLLALRSIFDGIGMGLAERITAVIKALEPETVPHFNLNIIDSVESYPYLYQQLLKKLSTHASIITEKFIPQASADSDLGKLQISLSTGVKAGELVNDGTLQILHFSNDILAANAIKSIHAASQWNPVIINKDNSLLNGLNLSHGLPVCKWQTSSGNGQVEQLFFLATTLFKRPVNTAQVLALLSSPITPIPKKLCRELLKLFASKPGFGSKDWNTAITDHLLLIKNSKNEESKNKSIAFWLQNTDKLKEPDLEITFLITIYTMLQKWALNAVHYTGYGIYEAQLMNLASLCNQLITILNLEGIIITTTKFERIQAELFIERPTNITEAQVGCADIAGDPGAIWSAAREVLWMDAIRNETANYLTKYWYQEEKVFFKNHELPVHDESHANAIYNEGIKRMVLCASERLVILVPQTINGSATAKPFCLDEWEKLICLKPITTTTDRLLKEIPWVKTINLTKQFNTIQFPVPQENLTIPKIVFRRDKESYSSLEKLFQHPAAWYMQYQLKLTYKEGISLPNEALLKGTIADSIVQLLFNEENRAMEWWKEEATFKYEAINIFKQVILNEGLPFLENKSKRFLQQYQQTLLTALCNLRNFIDVNNFTIKATQHQVNGNIDNTPFEGFVDLLLTKDGKNCVIDLKWVGSSKNYKEKLKIGTDLQLALYQSMGADTNKSGYFLFNDGILYMRDCAANNGLKSVTYIEANDGISTKIIHDKAINSIQYRREEMDNGIAEIAYHIPLIEIGYYTEIATKFLYPLTENKTCKKGLYDNDLDLFFGKIS